MEYNGWTRSSCPFLTYNVSTVYLRTEGRRLILRQYSVVFAGACMLDWSSTSENVSVSKRFEFVWRIRGYVHITMNIVQLVINFATFPVMDRTTGRVGSDPKSLINWRVGSGGSGLEILTRVELWAYVHLAIGGHLPYDLELWPIELEHVSHIAFRSAMIFTTVELGQAVRSWLIMFSLRTRYITWWPWPSTLWPWTCVLHLISRDQSLY